ICMFGSVEYKESSRASYTKVTAKVPNSFPVDIITSSDVMTITSELANGLVFGLSNGWLHGEAIPNPDEGTVDLVFHGEEGFY
ncbi:phage tail tube protein, partial [Salmonella enterica]|uniref:phage tail tube protein n=1 Tax=Salmonella enterica TaxID=28901 RepID=UPI0020C54243